MKSIFLLTYGWLDMPNEPMTETHPSIDSAEKSGNAFLDAERRFASIGSASPAYYKIERYDLDVVISEVKL